MSERNQKVLNEIRERTKRKEADDIQAFLNILTPAEKATFASLTMDKDKENFYNKVMISRAGALKDKLNLVSIDNKIAKDIMDVTPDNLKNYLKDLKSEELEAELATGIDAIKREYTSRASKVYVERRNKVNEKGELNTYITVDELEDIKIFVESELMKNPAYKFSLLVINNASGTITVFNDKIVESRRDYEISKLAFCNEKGMTPESFDSWQEYVKRSHEEALLESEAGFSNLPSFDKEWHITALKRFYKRDPKFGVEGEVVYESAFLKALDAYDTETLGASTNKTTQTILEDFDAGMIKYNPVNRTEDDVQLERALGAVNAAPKKTEKMKSAIEIRKENLKKKKEVVREEAPVELEVKRSSIADLYRKQSTVVVTDEPVGITTDKHVEDEFVKNMRNMTPKEEVIFDKAEEEFVNEATIETIEETELEIENLEQDTSKVSHSVVSPENKLKGFRNQEIEEKVLVKYTRKPDLSLLKTINNPKLRVTAYKNSAVVNGFRLYLAYSGFDVIIKKIQDKSKLSYVFSMITDMWDSQEDVDVFIEEETLKIVFENLEFPNFHEEMTFKKFIQHLSEGDIPILMVAFAMTNLPENKDGRILLDFSSLRCTECRELLPIEPISLDLKDLFSKIYPISEFKKSAQKAIQFDNIENAYRSTSNGEIHLLESTDDDGLCSFKVYYSRPTIFKNSTVTNKEAEANFNIVKDDMIERDHIYAKIHSIEGIGDYIKDMSYNDYLEKTAVLATYITMLASDADKARPEEIEAMKIFLNENMTQLNVITTVMQTSGARLQQVFNICRYLDAIVITSPDGEDVITDIETCQEDLYETISIISTMPKALVDRLSQETMKLGSTYKFEHENVYYTAEEIKGRISKEFLTRYNSANTQSYIEFLKRDKPSITEAEIDSHVAIREESYKSLLKGRCSCGNESFYINYIVIVFFSTFKG